MSALTAGLLGGATVAAVWISLNWTFGSSKYRFLPDWSPLTAGVLGGSCFIYGALGGAYLGRRRAGLALWMLSGGLLVGFTGLAIARFGTNDPFAGSVTLIPAAGGFLFGFFARLAPVRACAPHALRYSLPGVLLRFAPALAVSATFTGVGLWFLNSAITFVLVAIGLLGFSLIGPLAWQERRIKLLEKKLNALSAPR